MTEMVIALLMIVNGEIKEHRIQDSMSDCLKGKRIAMRDSKKHIQYQCLKSMAETEIYLGEKSILKLILKMKWLYAFLIAILVILGAKAENDTATSTNILPNAGTTSSNMDNHNLDGVNSGTGNLSNNSTHNGFTITCDTVVEGHCGRAFNGELESSRDMKVSAGDTLVGVTGTESGTTYTATQNKLDGGIILNSYFTVQNCEDGSSSFSCGQSSGADDSYVLHLKIKDADGNTLADITTTRLNDAGYNANSAKFEDSLTWNGTGGASYEWYWQGFDGQQSTSALRGPNLLGAELRLDFPIDDHEPLTLEERTVINEALNTTELTENEIYDIISGLESIIEEEFFASGNLEEGARVELSIEETGITIEVASTSTGAIVMEAPMVQEMFAPVMKEMPIETLKEEMVAMVQEEEMSFMEVMEEVSSPPTMEEPSKEEPKAMKSGPMIEEKTTKEPEPSNKEPATMEVASAPKEETPKEEESVKEEKSMVETKNEEQETEEKESNSEAPATSVVSKQDNTKQKKVQSKETVKPKLEKVMAKVDEKIKNPLKNLQLKNLLKMDAMVDNQLSLDSYNVAFYAPKDIYLDQLNLIDNRLIYANKSLATYIQNDKIEIKARKLGDINLKKQQLLNELEILKMGKLKDQLAGIAALIAAVVAIGGGFATYGKLTEKISVLENASKTVDLSIVAVLEEKIAQLESHEHEVNHGHTKMLVNEKEIELLKVQIEEIKVSTSNPLSQ